MELVSRCPHCKYFHRPDEECYDYDSRGTHDPSTEEVVRITIARQLKTHRELRRLSTRQLSKLSGVTDRQILRIEHCDPDHPNYDPNYTKMASVSTLLKLSNAMGISILDLLHDWSQDRE